MPCYIGSWLTTSSCIQADIRILKVCTLRNQPYILVRSKSDQHIWNCQNHLALDAEAAGAHYIEEARQDGSRTTTIGEVELNLADLLVSDNTLRCIINDEDLPQDPIRAPIDEVEFLRRLGLLP